MRVKGGSFEMWRGSTGPSEAYTTFLMESFKKVGKTLPQKGNTFDGLDNALRSVRMPLQYITEHGTGYVI